MLHMAVVFLVIAVIAALFGFGLVANASFATASQILFFGFIVLAILAFIGGAFRRPPV
jgi:uncharacterized membrane protein YtjA (UPF0391 family)